MIKQNTIILFIYILNILISVINASNLRKNTEIIQDIDFLIKGLPTSYSKLNKEMLSQKAKIKKELNLSYFKFLVSSSKIKYYLNKEQKDFDSVAKDIIKSMGLSNPEHAYVLDIFENKLTEHMEYYENNKWVNYNIITTVRNEANTISFGTIFVSLNEGKYNFIICYGYGNFKFNYNGSSIVFLGKNTYFDYLATSKTCNYSSKDCDFHDASYIIDFMNLVGFKSFGEVYGLALPDPNLN